MRSIFIDFTTRTARCAILTSSGIATMLAAKAPGSIITADAVVPVQSQKQEVKVTHADHNDAFVPGPKGESRIPSQVRHGLLAIPYYTVFDDLAFRVDGQTVTLLGAVINPVLKPAAENVAKRIEGITQVINQIRVLPDSPMDSVIRTGEWSAINSDPQIPGRYRNRALPPIHILVESGHITLEGFVDSQEDKRLINDRISAEATFLSGNPPNQVQISIENRLEVLDARGQAAQIPPGAPGTMYRPVN